MRVAWTHGIGPDKQGPCGVSELPPHVRGNIIANFLNHVCVCVVLDCSILL